MTGEASGFSHSMLWLEGDFRVSASQLAADLNPFYNTVRSEMLICAVLTHYRFMERFIEQTGSDRSHLLDKGGCYRSLYRLDEFR